MENGAFVPGCLFLFEGIDGSGKSTQVRLASANLTASGIAHIIVESPGQSKLAIDVLEVIARHDASSLTPATEALLHLAVMRSSLEEFVLPALLKGRHVLMDRSHLSTAAYQGADDMEVFTAALDSAAIWLQALRPNKIFFFDIDPQVAAERIRLRDDIQDKYDNLPVEQKTLVRERYLNLAERYKDNFVKVDTEAGLTTIADTLLTVILNEIELNAKELGR
ncbi:dTMP kinase [Methylobacterium sp. WL6]|uniref:dTMP kinase n=1 Tax=Methylobacterium sp. WL6 TaxID=2603901 RepID=UPI00165002F2|nr:dTMP kinase [Methylobacterium sp. WL6]